MDAALAGLVARYVQGDATNVAECCRQLQVSRVTFYKYVARFRREGVEGFFPRLRRPHAAGPRVDPALEELIVRARKELAGNGWDHGAASIRYRLMRRAGWSPTDEAGQPAPTPSRATIHRVLVRRGQVTPAPKKRPKRPGRRFERTHANELWQMDGFEVLLGTGRKAVVIQIVDDCTRKDLCLHAARSENGNDAWVAFTLAAEHAGGFPHTLLTDNGTAFSGQCCGWVSGLEAGAHQLGVATTTTAAYHPQTNGKDERAHGTVRQWLARHETAADLEELQALLDDYRYQYNHTRPHSALDGLMGFPRNVEISPIRRR